MSTGCSSKRLPIKKPAFFLHSSQTRQANSVPIINGPIGLSNSKAFGKHVRIRTKAAIFAHFSFRGSIHPLEVTVQSVSHRAKQPELPGRLDDPEGPIGSAQVVHDRRRLERGHVRELQLIGYPSPSPGRSQKARTSRLRCSSA